MGQGSCLFFEVEIIHTRVSMSNLIPFKALRILTNLIYRQFDTAQFARNIQLQCSNGIRVGGNVQRHVADNIATTRILFRDMLDYRSRDSVSFPKIRNKGGMSSHNESFDVVGHLLAFR